MRSRRSLLAASMLAVVATLGGCRVGGGGDAGPGMPDSRLVVRCNTTDDGDGDGIYDELETGADFDGDGTPNYLDDDSDGDGFLDRDEHGDPDGCVARDTDGDGLYDFLDLDRDGDGLSDAEERDRYFTNPSDDDSDDDGFTDLAEAATGHDPNDASSRIPEDTFYVVLPYLGEEVTRELVFGTTVRKADVFFMVDSTGSMLDEIARLRTGLATVVTHMRASLTDVGVGFGQFAGFGGLACSGSGLFRICADGPDGDLPFELTQVITTNDAEMMAAVGRLHAASGGANWASSNEALYLMATGEGFAPWLSPQSCPHVPDDFGMRHGYPCFRPGALPIAVIVTDTASKNGPPPAETYNPAYFTSSPRGPHTYEETLAALHDIGARVIGILSGAEAGNPGAQFETWARQTGTVDAAGNPILFTISPDGSGLDTSIVDAIRTLAEETPQDISATARDGADRPPEVGPVDATRFIKAITPVTVSGTSCPDPPRCDAERFYDVAPGNTVVFRIRFHNDFQMPRSSAQVFLATIVVLGNDVAELDSREVVIVVPAGSTPLI